MDELAAAAAVLAMDVDSEIDDATILEITDGSPGASTGTVPASGCATEDEENHTNVPVDRQLRTKNPKVNMHPGRLQSPPCP